MHASRTVGLALLALSTLVASGASAQATLVTGLGGPLDFGASFAPRGDDGSSLTAVDLTPTFPSGIDFYGQHFTDVWVNINGSLSFGAADGHFSPTAFPRASGPPMIAAWWADVDTTPVIASELDGNQVYWAATATQFVATWIDVGYFDAHTDLLDAFQIILTPPASGTLGAFDVQLRYHRCEWTTGDLTGGTGGLGGTAAQAGFDAADGTHFVMLPGSRDASVLALCTTSNLTPADPGVWNLTSIAPAPICGNGFRETGEACDDGNTQDHDFCDDACRVAVPCFTQYPDGGVDDPFPDATFPADVGACPMPDAGIDAAVDVDAAVPVDAATVRPDAGRRPDAGTRFDAGTVDANIAPDADYPNHLEVTGGGCGCRAASTRSTSGLYAMGLVLLALTRSRARARARAGTSRRP